MSLKQLKRLIISFALGLLALACGSIFPLAAVNQPDNWLVKLDVGGYLDQNPANTQWQLINGQLTAVSLADGSLVISKYDQLTLKWEILQKLVPAETKFTVFILKDLDNDGSTEIIAGTGEPGLVYTYHYQTTSNSWVGNNYAKYVWSAITAIAVLNPNYSESSNYFLLQNQEGVLYLLKKTDRSFDLVWQSPNPWRQILTMLVMDLDADANEEVIIIYKNGGVAILKLLNNTIVSVWENYFWGKILTITSGDWNNDQQPELLFSTSQKIIYSLGYSEKHYQFKEQLTHEYTIDCLYLIPKENKPNLSQLIATDTAGKTHLFEYDLILKEWQEQFAAHTGRITKIASQPNANQVYLWRTDHKVLILNSGLISDFKLQFQNQEARLTPQLLLVNGRLYIAPKSLTPLTALKLSCEEDPVKFRVQLGTRSLTVFRGSK